MFSTSASYPSRTATVTLSDESFPDSGIVPKTETQVKQFLKKYPEYDGRGIIVAILDTGCDPRAEGLTVTPDGRPKFIDVVDTTGSGDVDTSKKVKADESGLITGLSGRTLKVGVSWSNPSGEWHIGLLEAYNVFPKSSRERLEKERAKKWNERHDSALSNLRHAIQAAENEEFSAITDDSEKQKAVKGNKEKVDDLKVLLSQMTKEKPSESGPVFDVVTWHSGDEWLAVLDTSSAEAYFDCLPPVCPISTTVAAIGSSTVVSEKKEAESDAKPQCVCDLNACKVMTNFRVRQECDQMSVADCLTYNLNIYDNGQVVSVVTPAGAHGSHVAGITGAFHAKRPERNGMAPGCQLVSIKIGDTRLGTMESNQGLMRAIDVIKANGCHLANMSYGEPSMTPKSGCFPEAMDKLVFDYGLIFVSSAGNAGPAISSAGAPQCAANGTIGVGAVFSPAMIRAEYGFTDIPPLNAYSWTSRGPATDGGMGVKVCAPGAAITSIPKYTLSKNQLMNGTSMASPNCCGNVALLLSALKQLAMDYTPIGIERALINSAATIPNLESNAQGFGMVQVESALDYCRTHAEVIKSPVRFEVSISGGSTVGCPQQGDRGIYIRGGDVSKVGNYSVKISPKFPEGFDNDAKVSFEANVAIRCTSPWVEVSEVMVIPAAGRSFQVKVDLRKIADSALHKPVIQTEIVAFDSSQPLESGPLFRFPVTVVRCVHLDADGIVKRDTMFKTGMNERVFVRIPSGVSVARVSINALESADDSELSFFFTSMWLKNRLEQKHFDKYLKLAPAKRVEYTIEAQSGAVMEFNLTQRALAAGSIRVQWQVQLCGPSLASDRISLEAADSCAELTLTTAAYKSTLSKPSVKFETLSRFVAPTVAEIVPLSKERGDVTASGRQVYALRAHYPFDQMLSGSNGGPKVVPTLPYFKDLLYESHFQGAFWQVFDSNKKLVGSGEAFDETVKLPKQKGYVMKAEIRSADVGKLTKLKSNGALFMRLDIALSKTLSASIYGSRVHMHKGASINSYDVLLPTHSSRSLVIGAPDISAVNGLSKKLKPGTHLRGWFNCGGFKEGLKTRFRDVGAKGKAAICFPVVCHLSTPYTFKEKNGGDDNGGDEQKAEDWSLDSARRDALIAWVSALTGDKQLEAFEQLSKELPSDIASKYLPFLRLKLAVLNTAEAADELLAAVDKTAVSAFFGRKKPEDADDAFKKLAKERKEQKQAIVDALTAKLKILKESGEFGAFEDTWKELNTWIDTKKDEQLADYRKYIARRKGHFGALLALVNSEQKKGEEAVSKSALMEKKQVIETHLGADFAHVVEDIAVRSVVDFPADYRIA